MAKHARWYGTDTGSLLRGKQARPRSEPQGHVTRRCIGDAYEPCDVFGGVRVRRRIRWDLGAAIRSRDAGGFIRQGNRGGDRTVLRQARGVISVRNVTGEW